jgi:hypothetical protein
LGSIVQIRYRAAEPVHDGFVIAMGIWFGRYFTRKMAEDERNTR